MIRQNNTLKQLIFDHNNDYGFDVGEVIKKEIKTFPSLSVVLPFYDNKEIISLTLKHLYNGLNKVMKVDHAFKFEVIIIDDGSKEGASKNISIKKFPGLKIFCHRINRGRTAVRNKGLDLAVNDLCLFMDSDIIIDSNLILNHLKIHGFSRKQKIKAITIGFFEFSDPSNPLIVKVEILPKDIKLNDFRLDCIYQNNWIGCEDDKKHIGCHFKILEQTEMMRKWPEGGFLGPWLIANMVLGGFFMVDTSQSNKMGGFNSSFLGYGFTEISLPTKLIAGLNGYVIPVPFGGGLHIESKNVIVQKEREEKNRLFRKRHDYYFEHYLQLTLKEATLRSS